MKYIFGPVASRRLGLSLGIDIVPFKTCSFDCVYCECGPTTNKTMERQSFFAREEILQEVRLFLNSAGRADYLTFSGSGEPTLNKDIGWLIREIKKITDIPVAILTNGSLFHLPELRQEISAADVVVPSLDTVNKKVFRKLNQPHRQLNLAQLIDGIKQFRQEYKGQLWLEILFCQGINDDEKDVEELAKVALEIGADKIQLGTVHRPPAAAGREDKVMPVTHTFFERILPLFGPTAEVIGEFKPKDRERLKIAEEQDILAMLRRRPSRLEDIANALALNKSLVCDLLQQLVEQGKIDHYCHNGQKFFGIKKLKAKKGGV